MTRSLAIAYAADYFDSGAFFADLARRVAFRTESGVADHRPDMLAYLEQEMVPAAHRLGATAQVVGNPDPGGGPFLIAQRHEASGLPTVLTYGHAELRFVVGTDTADMAGTVHAHLHQHGFGMVDVEPWQTMNATRTDPDNPWVRVALTSLERTEGIPAVLLPNLGGSLPNDAFSDELSLPTIWIPHSYPACAQHAPDEHLLAPLARQALRLMAALFWDLGDNPGR